MKKVENLLTGTLVTKINFEQNSQSDKNKITLIARPQLPLRCLE